MNLKWEIFFFTLKSGSYLFGTFGGPSDQILIRRTKLPQKAIEDLSRNGTQSPWRISTPKLTEYVQKSHI